VTVPTTTTSVDLGPWPQGGTWSWTGPNGFTASTREIDNITLAVGANVYTASYTAGGTTYTQAFTITVSGTGSCGTTNPIVPYIEVSGTWITPSSSTATVSSTTTPVSLGPWPQSGGTWSWTGPNGFTASTREIDNIALSAGANTYTATYTISGCTYTQAFVITAPTTGGGSFSLAPSASTLSVAQGASGTDTVTVTDAGGFTGSVTLAATGLPSGVTATFGTNPTTGSSVVTFAASGSAAAGTYPVTITGTSGSLTATASITLTVTQPVSSAGCTVDYVIAPQSSTAFGGTLTIVNNGSTAIAGWTLVWTFANGQTISSLWNAVETQSGATVTLTNESYNGSIAAGASLTGIGFNGTWNGTTNAIPTTFTLNGSPCTVN
jgi:hypothetical protein